MANRDIYVKMRTMEAAADYTTADVARKIGVSRPLVYYRYVNAADMNILEFFKLCKVFGFTVTLKKGKNSLPILQEDIDEDERVQVPKRI